MQYEAKNVDRQDIQESSKFQKLVRTVHNHEDLLGLHTEHLKLNTDLINQLQEKVECLSNTLRKQYRRFTRSNTQNQSYA